MLAGAIEAEVSLKTDEVKAAVVVRKGYLPERSIQTGLGNIAVKVSKVRDRSESGLKFNSINSNLIPPYLKRTKRGVKPVLEEYKQAITLHVMRYCHFLLDSVIATEQCVNQSGLNFLILLIIVAGNR